MVHSLFSKADLELLRSVFQATVATHGSQSHKLIVVLEINPVPPPRWLDTLSFILVHEDRSAVACLAKRDNGHSTMSRFEVEAEDGRNLNEFFQARPGDHYLPIAEVIVTTAEGNFKAMVNSSSLELFLKRPPRDENDLEECIVDPTKLPTL